MNAVPCHENPIPFLYNCTLIELSFGYDQISQPVSNLLRPLSKYPDSDSNAFMLFQTLFIHSSSSWSTALYFPLLPLLIDPSPSLLRFTIREIHPPTPSPSFSFTDSEY